MGEDTKQLLIAVIGIVLAFAAVAFPTAWYYATVEKAAIEAGYEQVTLPGENGVHWRKPE